jgi:hypothetical protein
VAPKPVELLDGPRTHPGLRAVNDLQRWLTLSIADVARLTGVAESTIYWWKKNPTSTVRPAKVDRLLGLHALAGGLVHDLGEDDARRWFRFGNPSLLEQLRQDPGSLPAVERTGYDLLLERARMR